MKIARIISSVFLLSIFLFNGITYSSQEEHITALRVPIVGEKRAYYYMLEEHRLAVLNEMKTRIKRFLEYLAIEEHMDLYEFKDYVKSVDDITIFIHGSITKPGRCKNTTDIDMGVILNTNADLLKNKHDIQTKLKIALGNSVKLDGCTHNFDIMVTDRGPYEYLAQYEKDVTEPERTILRASVFPEALYFAATSNSIFGNQDWEPFIELKEYVVQKFREGAYYPRIAEEMLKDLDEYVEKALETAGSEDYDNQLGMVSGKIGTLYPITNLFRIVYETKFAFPRSLAALRIGLESISEFGHDTTGIYAAVLKSLGADDPSIVNKEYLIKLYDKIFMDEFGIYDRTIETVGPGWWIHPHEKPMWQETVDKLMKEGDYEGAYGAIIHIFINCCSMVNRAINVELEGQEDVPKGERKTRLTEDPNIIALNEELKGIFKQFKFPEKLAGMVKAGEEVAKRIRKLIETVKPFSIDHPDHAILSAI